MTKNEKMRRISDAIEETNGLLAKAKRKYEDSVKYLLMEIEDNMELGNPAEANLLAVKHVINAKARVKELEAHLATLNNMLSAAC